MKYLLTIVLGLTFALPALADDPYNEDRPPCHAQSGNASNDCPGGGGGGTDGGDGTDGTDGMGGGGASTNTTNTTTTTNSLTTQGGDADVNVGANTNAQTANSSFNYTESEVHQAPDQYLIPSNNTGRCLGAWGLGVSGANEHGAGSALVGWPMTMADCMLQIQAETAYSWGNYEAAWRYHCEQKHVKKAWRHNLEKKGFGPWGWKKQAFAACNADGLAIPIAIAISAPIDYATKSYVDGRLEHIFEASQSK